MLIFATNYSVLSAGKTLAAPYVEDNCYSEVEDDVQSEPSEKKQNDNKPGWMYGSWRTLLDNDGGVLIVYLDYNYASMTIMDGLREVLKVKYDGWAIVGDLVFLGNDGDKLKDAPYLKIDHNRQLLLTAKNQYMEKH